MKRQKLDISYDFDFDLIGISSQLKEYKLAWLLNKELDIHFIKDEDIRLELIDTTLTVLNYSYMMGSSRIRLIRNKTVSESMELLMPELRQFDYLMTLDGEGNTFTSTELLNRVRIIPEIQYAMILELDKLKSKDNLIF